MSGNGSHLSRPQWFKPSYINRLSSHEKPCVIRMPASVTTSQKATRHFTLSDLYHISTDFLSVKKPMSSVCPVPWPHFAHEVFGTVSHQSILASQQLGLVYCWSGVAVGTKPSPGLVAMRGILQTLRHWGKTMPSCQIFAKLENHIIWVWSYQSLWNSTGGSAAMLPSYLSNFTVIWQNLNFISWLYALWYIVIRYLFSSYSEWKSNANTI